MKTVLLIAAAYCISFFPTQDSSVYICVSPTAQKYHFTKSCRGLQKCTHTIKQVSREEALRLNYTVCLVEK